ncbi:MAG: winged helix-turn-helix domain-containing protein [Deltaproteobacteria bacterium]|nr:winged helix-turn-helix domain-containing protein [Deltaproteobacteria bacterium]MBW2286049.1 winged helix-turn-helix domain-containing protein [Deltaproteobacteria bacterium]
MSEKDEEKTARKEAMKKLRQDRKQTVKAAAARMKEQNKAVKAIKEQLKDDAGTVPDIAGATGIPSSDVMWYVATMKKYGDVVEADQDGSYFRYRLAESGAEEAGE